MIDKSLPFSRGSLSGLERTAKEEKAVQSP